MNRRGFLKTAAAGAAMASWPGWLREGFAAKGQNEDNGVATLAALSEGYRRAQRAGKPLLILVIPEDSGEKWRRGEAFGELLNHGSEAELAQLALCEVACAEMAKVRRLVPDAGSGEPLMILVETDRVPATVQRLDAELPTNVVPHDEVRRDSDKLTEKDWREIFAEQQRREDAAIQHRIATLAGLIHGAVAPREAVLERRAAQARAKLDPVEVASVEAALQQGVSLPVDQVDRAAALVALAALRAQAQRRVALRHELAQATAARLRKVPPPGARWANASGCGTTVEGEEDRAMVIGCGMGHVPEKSSRFLYFFAKSWPEL